ncbi:MAG: hypothetical protein KIT37_00415 [Steroidobacteraceae bacterium]|nr:hypothetical protein [Steroidobacteraceae bacterium]
MGSMLEEMAARMDSLYSLYDALVSINVPSDKARAVVDAMERDMTTSIATKADMQMLQREIEILRRDVAKDMELLRSSITIRLGSMLMVAVSILFAALKLT